MSRINKTKYLQEKFEQVLEKWLLDDSKENRISLFNVFNMLVIEILKDDFKITGEKCYNYAFHYSLDLLDTFISQNTYQAGLTGHEVVQSIRLSVMDYLKEQKHIVDEDIFSGFEAFTQNVPEDDMLNYEIFSEINELLAIFFDDKQIKRYLPLAVSIISSGNHSKIVNLNDQNFKYFCMLLISLGKKLGKYYQENVSTLNHSVNELTILIAGVNQNSIPQELVFACDLSSLDRLVEFAGGKTLTIPTREELKRAYDEIKDSIRYPSIQAKVEPLEENFGASKSQSTTDQTFDLFCGWLAENKKGLSQDKLDRILKILSE